jgi:hypothetical protein
MLESIPASEPVFQIQALTLLTIISTAAAWIIVFDRTGRRRILKLVCLPLALWAVSGTLDVMVTAQAVIGSSLREANPLARAVFAGLHPYGPPVAALLWIILWAAVSFLLDIGLHPVNKRLNAFTQLTLFYSLALGHLYAASGWMGWDTLYYIGFTVNQQAPILNHMVAGVFYLTWVAEAMVLSALHLTVHKAFWGGTG